MQAKSSTFSVLYAKRGVFETYYGRESKKYGYDSISDRGYNKITMAGRIGGRKSSFSQKALKLNRKSGVISENICGTYKKSKILRGAGPTESKGNPNTRCVFHKIRRVNHVTKENKSANSARRQAKVVRTSGRGF